MSKDDMDDKDDKDLSQISGPKYRKKQIEAGVRMMLGGLGVDLEDENFKDTPQRVAKAYIEMCSSLYVPEKKVADIFGKKFKSDYKGAVIVGPVTAAGVCPHHLLPVHITAVLAYIPREEKLGLSKLARAIRHYCAAPAMQETASHALMEAFSKYVDPLGAALWMKGSHGCMTARGIKEPCAKAITLDVRGLFEKDPGVKTEFMQQLNLLVGT